MPTQGPATNSQFDSRLIAPTSAWQEAGHAARVGSVLITVRSLSSRERSILEGISQGKSNKEIAKDLSITPETVKSHVRSIFIKLAVKKRAHAVARAQGSEVETCSPVILDQIES